MPQRREERLRRRVQGPVVDAQAAEGDAALKALYDRAGEGRLSAVVPKPIAPDVAQRRSPKHIHHQVVAVGADQLFRRPFPAVKRRMFRQKLLQRKEIVLHLDAFAAVQFLRLDALTPVKGAPRPAVQHEVALQQGRIAQVPPLRQMGKGGALVLRHKEETQVILPVLQQLHHLLDAALGILQGHPFRCARGEVFPGEHGEAAAGVGGNAQGLPAVHCRGLFDQRGVFHRVLRVKTEELERVAGGEYSVVANLPYYITTPVIMKFIEEARHCKRLVIMVQEEVAERLCAEENTPEYGAITASVALCGDARTIKKVPRTMFYPVPNVDSAVVRIDIGPLKFGVTDAEFYRKTVRAAFANRRKTLVNNLILSFGLTRGKAEDALREAGIDLLARGETLSAEKFAQLSSVLRSIIIN